MHTHGSDGGDAHDIHPDATSHSPDAEDLASKAAQQAAEVYADNEHEMRKRRFERAISLATDNS